MRPASCRRFPATAALLVASLLCSWAAAPAAEPAKAPASLEEQLRSLSAALAESFNTGDWEMLEMVAEGVRAAGLKPGDLEIFALSSERDAALTATSHRSRIILWGLAFRARLGGEKALAALRERAGTRPAPVEYPKTGGPGATEAWKAWHQYQAALVERDESLLVLALLGEKTVGVSAWEALGQGGGSTGMPGMGHGASTLVMAVLAADGEAGWKKLAGFCTPNGDDAALFGRRLAVLSSLSGLAGTDRPGNRAAAFRLEGRLARTLPADAGATLRAAFVKLAEKLPETETANFGIIHTAQRLPGLAGDQQALGALKGLKGRCQGNAARQWDMMIDNVVSPPRPRQPATGGPGAVGKEPPERF